jgi:gallate decarboxylase subunit D
MNRFNLKVEKHNMGRDAVFLVTGGEAHIGSVSTAYCDDQGTVELRTTVLPGHKEDVFTAPLAVKAAELLRQTVTVAAGIHIDNASRTVIDEIVREVHVLFDDMLSLTPRKAR